MKQSHEYYRRKKCLHLRDIINFKTYKKSFKNKTRRDNPPDKWVIFKDVHEPIIDRETFERVQEYTKKTKRRAPKAEISSIAVKSDKNKSLIFFILSKSNHKR